MPQSSTPEKDKTSKLKTLKMLAMLRKKGEKSTPVITDGMLAMICSSERRIFICPNSFLLLLNFFSRAKFASVDLPVSSSSTLSGTKFGTIVVAETTSWMEAFRSILQEFYLVLILPIVVTCFGAAVIATSLASMRCCAVEKKKKRT